VELRERLAVPAKEIPEAVQQLTALEGVGEAVVLSTCNRMEIYVDTAPQTNPQDAWQTIVHWLATHFSLPTQPPEGTFFMHRRAAAAEHLFSVAGGLDSMVLGETEIFGQVKDAYAAAHAAGATSRTLNKLFQEAFRAGKAIRNNTDIQRGSTSIGAVAVELAEKLFGELDECRVMLLGAGEISRRTAQSLQSRGAKSIIVSNRNYDRAVEMAAEMNGEALHFDAWPTQVNTVDILITSTSAPHTVVHPAELSQAMKKRRGGRPLFIIDIAVPRDVDPAVNDLENVYLFDIDALEQIADEGRQRREKELIKCRELIADLLKKSSILGPEDFQPTSP
jgi:glutamyl-tRNA reductase